MNRTIGILLIIALMIPTAMAQLDENNAPEMRPVIETYIVKKGDTLSKLARLHLGPDAPWDTNVAVNPDLENPDRIFPGQQVNIITGYQRPEPEIVVEEVDAYQALIKQVSNVVEKNIARSDWQDAAEGDELFPLDAVRTLAKSAALLQFDNSSTVLVNEYSQIFLRALEVQEPGISRSEIEILRGETDLRLDKTDAPQQQIEINVAGTITRPERDAMGGNSTRARIVGEDATHVMVYEGSSAVESAGTTVSVGSGMGTTAVAGQPPAEPERLLPAPEIKTLDEPLYPADVRFEWLGVEGAVTYRVDICEDRPCTRPIYGQRDIAATSLGVPSLAVGTAYWRVTAVSQSGLDGFTSPADQFDVVDAPAWNRYWVLIIVLVALLVLGLIAIVLFRRTKAKSSDVPGTMRLEDEPTKKLDDEVTKELDDPGTQRLDADTTEQLDVDDTRRIDNEPTKPL